jgi:hypothetical protein
MIQALKWYLQWHQHGRTGEMQVYVWYPHRQVHTEMVAQNKPPRIPPNEGE